MKKATVLIVEDDKDVAYIMTHTVNRLGFSVVGNEDTGERAIKVAEELKPDIVLMDIKLNGEMDGIETAEKLGRDYKIPVIYITAMTDDKTLERIAASAPYGFILKPFRDEELRAVIEIALDARASR
ncbi:MAG: two-component response regulator [Methanoregula sp. PtaU1.Bin051]|nr:MAG: two-component response regulator [Methanoregula sp. PtaU1.Bin051]